MRTQDAGQMEMDAFRRAAEEVPLPETIGALVKRSAVFLGNKQFAYWFEDKTSLTYEELDRSADRLADSLVKIGVRKGTHVAVMLSNIPAFPITWIALGRIGAVMIPVNTQYTGDEVSFVVNDSDAQFMVVSIEYLETVRGMKNRPAMLVDGNLIVQGATVEGTKSWDSLEQSGEFPFEPPAAVFRSDLMNIQYTSGTTGFPKGCMLTHDYWMLITDNASAARKDEIKNILIWAPCFYLDPQWQFLLAMMVGGTAFVAKRMSLTKFFDWLRDYRIHYCIFPEPALKQKEPSPSDHELELKFVSIYGWRTEARREFENRFNALAREAYGMTEIGSAMFMPRASGDRAYERKCGLLAPFRELRIVDESGNDVPQGEIGELWCAGRSILLGYYKRPEANAESFRGRWFRTGDLLRQDEEGYYSLVGRIKDMVRRAGENIAAQEVESALRDLPEIEEAAVVPVPDPLRREEVKAYLKLRAGLKPSDVPPEAVLAHCEKRLARFKIPRYIAYVEDFPRTPSRKIKKKTLIAETEDLRTNAYDREGGVWR